MNPQFQELANKAGIHFVGVNPQLQQAGVSLRQTLGQGGAIALACDAQPSLVTTSNSGIPAFLSTFIDPKLIEVLVAPMKAAEIVGDETKKGDWTSSTAMFPTVESTGVTSAYGDYSESGNAGANLNYPQRQSFHYQVVTQWGELELERAGLARVDWANRLNISSVLTLNKFQNKSYFFGIDGLQNYGLLNDPALSAAISPTTKVAGGTAWATATANEVLNDVAKLFQKLQTQANGLVDRNTPMVLAMSALSDADGLTKVSEFNVSVADRLKKLYPNLEVRTAPEYTTGSGELLQLIVPELEGLRTATCAFTEKLRAHPIKIELSSFKQKKSQGTWGTVIFRPFLIAQMLGV